MAQLSLESTIEWLSGRVSLRTALGLEAGSFEGRGFPDAVCSLLPEADAAVVAAGPTDLEPD